jgi:site-specific recombinase XerD
MDKAIQAFESYLKRRYPKSSTAKSYVSDLQVFKRFVEKAPRKVGHADIARFVEDQLERGLAATTVNRRLASLHHFFEFLADEADDEEWTNPVNWRRQRVKEGKPLPRDLSDQEVERLFAYIHHPRDRLMFGLMYWIGLRVGEVAALRVSDLIPGHGPAMGARLRVLGKGQKERVVPVGAALVAQWEAWLAERPPVASDRLFITRRKAGISTRGIQERLAHYAQQAGMQVSCHQLRHTFGRRMIEGQMPVLSLSKLMGHAQVTTTQVYIAGAGVDVRTDYETAMSHLEAGPPGSPLFPAAPSGVDTAPRAPIKPDSGHGAAASVGPEVPETPLDVSRFWDGFPAWLSESLSQYIDHQQRRWKPSQVRHHTRVRLQSLRQVWQWLLQEREIEGFADVGRRDLQAYVQARLQQKRAASTLNRQLRDLWAFLRFVERQGESLSPGVFRVAPLKEGHSLPRFLSEEQYRRLEERVLNQTMVGTRDDYLDRAWFYLLAHQGLRISELCDLRIADIDLEGQRLVVRQGKGKRDRFIPLSATTVDVVRDYLAVRGTGRSDHLLLFRQQKVKATLVQGRLRRYGCAVDVKVSPHRLRHTLATRLLNSGMDLVSIQHLLGHEQLSTTQIYARVYDRTVEQDFHEAMNCLESNSASRSAVTQPQSARMSAEMLFHVHNRHPQLARQ